MLYRKLKENLSQIKKIGLSGVIVLLILVSWISIHLGSKFYSGEVIRADVTHYYCYLPAIFIYHDIELNYIDSDPFLSKVIGPELAPNGKKVSKTTMGLAILWLPFFLLGHLAAILYHYPINGYCPPYYFFLYIGVFFYLLLGLLALRKVLLQYFSEHITALTLLSIYFGTNLLFYSTVDPLMPHVFIFSFISMILYMTYKWHQKPNTLNSIILGLLFGFIILIRPVHILTVLIPILYGVHDKETFGKKFHFLKEKYLQLFLVCLAIFIVSVPQLVYWKRITGNWLYYPYSDERFYFSHPHITAGLLSYRKGWLLYTPIMCFSLLGFFVLKKYVTHYFYSVLILFLIFFYVTLSWWCWWYGGSYGLRAFIDYYGILALPMAAFYQRCAGLKQIFKIVSVSIVSLLIALSCFQTYQARIGLIHYDGMTKEVYWMIWGKTEAPKEFWNKLKQPDYEKARRGENEN